MTLTVAFALGAALSSAVNLMTRHSASVGAPKREKGWRLVAYLFRQPPWLLGWIAAAGAFVCQAVALHYGQLSVVQPILLTELVFVLVLRRVWIRQDVARAAWAALTRWPVYALVAAVITGTLLDQSAPRRALERVQAASGHCQPARQHHLECLAVRLECLAVRRALHRQPGEDRHCRPGHGGLGRWSHRAVANGAKRSQPLKGETGGTAAVLNLADAGGACGSR